MAILLAILAVTGCRGATDKTCEGLATSRMVWVPGGAFVMGEDPRYAEEGPPHRVSLRGFWIDQHELTNREFKVFVTATGYRTVAELAPPTIPGAPPEMLVPGSAVFVVPKEADPRWWHWVPGADWRHPSGPSTSITGKDRQPVVQLAYRDAEAYARWAGKQLPTEEQWEYAARAGHGVAPEPVDAHGKPQANYYQGVFPVKDTGADGYTGLAPVGCFKPNAFGLYDMIGNAWEWTSSLHTARDGDVPAGVVKGGSYLCAGNYCARYRFAARQFQELDLGTNHIGVRFVDNGRLPPPWAH